MGLSAAATVFLSLAYPVGSIFTSVVATNPGTLLGIGTWTAFGAGRVPVGLDAAQTEFDTVEETGGAKTVTLDTTMIPAHLHTVNPPATNTSTDGAHTHPISTFDSGAASGTRVSNDRDSNSATEAVTGSNGDHLHSVDIAEFNSGSSGGGASHQNLQPYIVVYMWKRTA